MPIGPFELLILVAILGVPIGAAVFFVVRSQRGGDRRS